MTMRYEKLTKNGRIVRNEYNEYEFDGYKIVKRVIVLIDSNTGADLRFPANKSFFRRYYHIPRDKRIDNLDVYEYVNQARDLGYITDFLFTDITEYENVNPNMLDYYDWDEINWEV